MQLFFATVLKNCGVGVTVAGGWKATIPQPTPNKWFFVAATWDQGNQACVSMDGGQKQCERANNGWDKTLEEQICIGGRQPQDGDHNPNIMIRSVQVYNRTLPDDEISDVLDATWAGSSGAHLPPPPFSRPPAFGKRSAVSSSC